MIHNNIENLLKTLGIGIVHQWQVNAKAGKYHAGNLELGECSKEYVNRNYSKGLYEHQYLAAKAASERKNVCIATSTSSGKTAFFHLAALEVLSRDQYARILAVYPMRALGNQQKESWKRIGNNVRCGHIDGTVTSIEERLRILRECQVVTMTPDVVHTFLLGCLQVEKARDGIIAFLKNLRLVIIDELHLYRGMLGTNSAYLFRRLNSIIQLLGHPSPQYITASATIKDPALHSERITGGKDFELIGPDKDTSPSSAKYFYMVERGSIGQLLRAIREQMSDRRSITFVDSRKRVEEIAQEAVGSERIEDILIFPYRSGYEKNDYNTITAALGNGSFYGVVSTSALEVGIDIKDLEIAIIDGMPNSSTSYNQRIGRVGRGNAEEAVIIIVKDPNNIRSLRVFDDPNILKNGMVAEEPALYLDNEYIKNVQALHFVGEGKELISVPRRNDFERIRANFSESFANLCVDILNEQTAGNTIYTDKVRDLGGQRSQLRYTLRQFGVQYKAVLQERNEITDKGDLTSDQVAREAYVGALYRYQGETFRVIRIKKGEHRVIINNERTFNKTKPNSRISVIPQKNTTIKHLKWGKFDVIYIESFVPVPLP